jgi:Peptidase inhibitor family I36
MSRKNTAVIVGLIAVLGARCGDSPTTPSTSLANSLVTVYQDPEFRGNSRALMAGDQPDLDALAGPCGAGVGGDWDDCISSIRVPSGWEITLYEHDNFSGASQTFTADVNDLERRPGPCSDGWDDCASSIRIRQR